MVAVDPAARSRHRRRNAAQALLLLGGMALTAALLAWFVAGPEAIVWVAVVTMVAIVWRPRVSPGWVLQMYDARPIPPAVAPDLHRVVRALAEEAGLERPPVLYYVPARMLNAFAVGRRDDAAIAVTDGLLRHLSGRELTAVLAHEVSHIRADDLWIMTLADVVARTTHALAYGALFLLLLGLPFAAGGGAFSLLLPFALALVPTVITLLQLALSRTREYDADLEAATMTGDPVALADALRKLEHHEGPIWERILVPHKRTPDPLLLRTHPATEERVRRLLSLVPPSRRRVALPDGWSLPAGYAAIVEPARLRFPGVRW